MSVNYNDDHEFIGIDDAGYEADRPEDTALDHTVSKQHQWLGRTPNPCSWTEFRADGTPSEFYSAKPSYICPIPVRVPAYARAVVIIGEFGGRGQITPVIFLPGVGMVEADDPTTVSYAFGERYNTTRQPVEISGGVEAHHMAVEFPSAPRERDGIVCLRVQSETIEDDGSGEFGVLDGPHHRTEFHHMDSPAVAEPDEAIIGDFYTERTKYDIVAETASDESSWHPAYDTMDTLAIMQRRGDSRTNATQERLTAIETNGFTMMWVYGYYPYIQAELRANVQPRFDRGAGHHYREAREIFSRPRYKILSPTAEHTPSEWHRPRRWPIVEADGEGYSSVEPILIEHPTSTLTCDLMMFAISKHLDPVVGSEEWSEVAEQTHMVDAVINATLEHPDGTILVDESGVQRDIRSYPPSYDARWPALYQQTIDIKHDVPLFREGQLFEGDFRPALHQRIRVHLDLAEAPEGIHELPLRLRLEISESGIAIDRGDDDGEYRLVIAGVSVYERAIQAGS